MKQISIFLLVMVLLFPTFAQEVAESEISLEPFLFKNNVWLGPYRQADGVSLTRNETRRLVSVVPRNNVLLRQEKIFNIVATITGSLALTSWFKIS